MILRRVKSNPLRSRFIPCWSAKSYRSLIVEASKRTIHPWCRPRMCCRDLDISSWHRTCMRMLVLQFGRLEGSQCWSMRNRTRSRLLGSSCCCGIWWQRSQRGSLSPWRFGWNDRFESWNYLQGICFVILCRDSREDVTYFLLCGEWKALMYFMLVSFFSLNQSLVNFSIIGLTSWYVSPFVIEAAMFWPANE